MDFEFFNESLIKGHGDVEFARMSFDVYLDNLELGIVPNVLPNHIQNFFSNRNK